MCDITSNYRNIGVNRLQQFFKKISNTIVFPEIIYLFVEFTYSANSIVDEYLVLCVLRLCDDPPLIAQCVSFVPFNRTMVPGWDQDGMRMKLINDRLNTERQMSSILYTNEKIRTVSFQIIQ